VLKNKKIKHKRRPLASRRFIKKRRQIYKHHTKIYFKSNPSSYRRVAFYMASCIIQTERSMRNLTIHGVVENGQHGLVVDIECQLTKGLPGILIVGYANRAVDEAKERIRNAFASSNLTLPIKRITVNLAPADIPKESTGFDLAIATAILRASDQCKELPPNCAIIGELGLEGAVRPVRGVIGKLLAGTHHGIDTFIIPSENLAQASLVPDIKVIPVASLFELYQIVNGHKQPGVIDTNASQVPEIVDSTPEQIGLEDVVGQALGKRAVEISAAGGHNILLGGPPGTGKSMLANILPSLLPPMTRPEMLEVTHLHSLASNDFNQLVTQRPFRSPSCLRRP
jgi:magnesium chelatase family protein